VSDQLHVPAPLPPEKEPTVPFQCGWVVPRAGLDAVAKKRKHPFPAPAKDEPLTIQPVARSLY